jgi:hypothetical protein
VDGANEQRRWLGNLLCENSEHGQTVNIGTIDCQNRDCGVAGRENFLQTIDRIGFDAIASQAFRNPP